MTLPTLDRTTAPSSASNLQFDYDIAIIGGGIVGLTVALGLKDSGLKVAVIEAQAKSDAIAKGQAYAIHLCSRQIWQKLGIWEELEPLIEPFTRVKLTDGNFPHVVEFHPKDIKSDAVGHVAEHRAICQVMFEALKDSDNITLFNPVKVDQLSIESDIATLNLQSLSKEFPDCPPQIRTRLIIGADGTNSKVRQHCGIKTRGWRYKQSCIVATVQSELPHNNTAYEKFWPSGPFAILPSTPKECRIVWTVHEKDADQLVNMDLDSFTEQLQQRYGHQMGKIQVVSQRYAFPAKIEHATDYVRSRVALVGNAAHTYHPVGGQGLNLGIRDADALATTILKSYYRGQDIGELNSLKPYQRWRKKQNFASLGFTDVLNRVFSNEFPILKPLRRLGLRLMQWIPWIKVLALKFMAGILVF